MPNADKKLAIYYYKGPGMNAMTAGGWKWRTRSITPCRSCAMPDTG